MYDYNTYRGCSFVGIVARTSVCNVLRHSSFAEQRNRSTRMKEKVKRVPCWRYAIPSASFAGSAVRRSPLAPPRIQPTFGLRSKVNLDL